MDARGSRLRDVVVLLALGVVVGAVFFTRFPLPLKLMATHLASAGTAMIVLAASATCGSLAFVVARRAFAAACGASPSAEKPDGLEVLCVGIPVFGTLVAAIAWTGIRIELLVAVTAFSLAIPAAARLMRAGLPAAGGLPARGMIALAVPVAFALVEALSPVASPDEMIYKLAVPHAYQQWGAMVELPLNSNSYFPNAIYMADFAAMVIGGGAAARMLHFAVFLLTLRIAWRLGNELREGAGVWVAATFAWTPALLLIGGWAWAEWPMLGLLLLSWHRWWRFLHSGDDPADAAIAALALAGAIATKYTAGVWTAVFLPLALLMLLRRRGGNVLRIVMAAAGVLLLFGGFFYIRNVVWTGSPLAPFGLPGSPTVSNFRSEHGGLYELLMGWDIFHAQIIDDALGILLPVAVLASPLALLRFRPRHLELFAFGVIQSIVLVLIAPTSRLILLGLAPLAVLGAVAAFDIYTTADRARRGLLATGIALGIAGQFVLGAFVLSSYEPLDVLTGRESERAYLERMRDYAQVYRWIESRTPEDSVILLLGESRAYHLNRRAHWAGNHDGPRVAAWLGQSRDADQLRGAMRALGVTHILLHRKHYIVEDISKKPPAMLEKEYLLIVPASVDEVLRACLRAHAKVDYSDPKYLLFKLE